MGRAVSHRGTLLERWPEWWSLAVVAVAVTGLGIMGTVHVEPEPGERSVDFVAVAIVSLGGASLLFRRRWPATVLAVVTAGVVVYILREYPGGPVYLLVPVALYGFAAANDRRVGYLGAAVTVSLLVGVRFTVDGAFGADDLVMVGWGAAAALAADAMRSRHERAAADRERSRFAEQRREEELRRRIAEDRLQIARDLHDSVAHSMATINVQSGVAGHVIDRRPVEAKAALEAIRTASRDVLDELAAMLAVLRDGTPPHHQPTPDLTSLGGLVESSQRAGLMVETRTSGDLAAVSPPVSTAAYRIVQEALTNVVRHARTHSAAVTVVHHGDGRLDVEVVDDGAGADVPPDGPGMGLIGIRERAEATGGRCTIGRRPEGGFRVAVSWPGRS